MRPVVVRLQFYCPMCDSAAANCIDVADICIAEPLSMLYVAISRNHFDDDIVAPNIDVPSNVGAVAVAAVVVGFGAAIALVRAALATDSVALAVDCMTTMIVAMMMMVGVEPLSPLQTTFDCSGSLIEPSENEDKEEKT